MQFCFAILNFTVLAHNLGIREHAGNKKTKQFGSLKKGAIVCVCERESEAESWPQGH